MALHTPFMPLTFLPEHPTNLCCFQLCPGPPSASGPCLPFSRSPRLLFLILCPRGTRAVARCPWGTSRPILPCAASLRQRTSTSLLPAREGLPLPSASLRVAANRLAPPPPHPWMPGAVVAPWRAAQRAPPPRGDLTSPPPAGGGSHPRSRMPTSSCALPVRLAHLRLLSPTLTSLVPAALFPAHLPCPP